MERLETLTAEQADLIPKFKEKWENYVYKNDGIDRELCEYGLEFLYKVFVKAPAPTVAYVKSPVEAQMVINSILMPKIRNHIESLLKIKIDPHDPKEYIFKWEYYRDIVVKEIKGDKGLKAMLEYNYPSSYVNIGDYGWVGFYDFIESLNHFKSYDFTKFNNFKDLLRSGLYEIYPYDKVCFVCHMPKIKQNEDNQLHNVSGPAVTWIDGYKNYFVNNRDVEPELIEKGFTKEDLINETNQDKRALMATIIRDRDGLEGLLNFLEAEIVDEQVLKHSTKPSKDDQGNMIHAEGYTETIRLYKTKEKYDHIQDAEGNLGAKYCWAAMVCPSTGTLHLAECPPHFDDALEAMKFLRPSFVPKELKYDWPNFAN